MKDIKIIIKEMVRGNIFILMVHIMMVNGNIIKCKVKVNIIIMIH